jgi:hypothetical protein
MLGFVLFLAAVTLIIGLWNTTIREVLSTENDIAMEETGSDMAEKLLRTPGYPENWDESNVTSIGLANQSRVLMRRKILSFIHLTRDNETGHCSGGRNYECNTHLLGIGGYQFQFNMTYLNGSTIILNKTLALSGRAPVNETRSVTIERTGLLEGDVVRAYITIWR